MAFTAEIYGCVWVGGQCAREFCFTVSHADMDDIILIRENNKSL